MVVGDLPENIEFVAFEVVADEIVFVCDVVADAEGVVTEGVPSESHVLAVPYLDALDAVFVEVVCQDGGAVGVPEVLAELAVANGVIIDKYVIGGDTEPAPVVFKEVASDGVSKGFRGNTASTTVFDDVVADDVSSREWNPGVIQTDTVFILSRISDYDVPLNGIVAGIIGFNSWKVTFIKVIIGNDVISRIITTKVDTTIGEFIMVNVVF